MDIEASLDNVVKRNIIGPTHYTHLVCLIQRLLLKGLDDRFLAIFKDEGTWTRVQ